MSDDNRSYLNTSGSTRSTSDASSRTHGRKCAILIHSKRASNQPPPQAVTVNDRISQQSDKLKLLLSCETLEDTEDWYNQIIDGVKRANNEKRTIQKMEQQGGICQEISDLVVYCKAVKTMSVDPEHFDYSEMISFSENQFRTRLDKGLVAYNTWQLSRVYPNMFRVKSDNFDPIKMWNAGVQMVALNCQTPDRGMQLHYGRFMSNGKCGYVLKPSYMRPEYSNSNDYADYHLAARKARDAYNRGHRQKAQSTGTAPRSSVSVALESINEMPIPSLDETTTSGRSVGGVAMRSVTVHLRLIAGRHLTRRDKSRGTVSPQVEIEMCGMPCDTKSFKVPPITNDGLHPVWNEEITFHVDFPELALLRFSVEDADYTGGDTFIGQTVLPLDSCRTGFRSVPLCNAYSEPLELSALLVHMQKIVRGPDGGITKRSENTLPFSLSTVSSSYSQGYNENSCDTRRVTSTSGNGINGRHDSLESASSIASTKKKRSNLFKNMFSSNKNN